MATNKTFGRGLIQAHAASAMIKHSVTVAKQGNKEKAIETLTGVLGDKDDARARQVINYLLQPENAKALPLKDLRDRLKAKAAAPKAPAKKKAAKKAVARKAPRQAPAQTEERAAA